MRIKVRSMTLELAFIHTVGRKVNINTLKWAFLEAFRKKEMRGFRIHDLRQTFASPLAENEVDPYSIQKLMALKIFSTTRGMPANRSRFEYQD